MTKLAIDPHANYSPDWVTPVSWRDWARQTLGGDYYDPCPADRSFQGDGRRRHGAEVQHACE